MHTPPPAEHARLAAVTSVADFERLYYSQSLAHQVTPLPEVITAIHNSQQQQSELKFNLSAARVTPMELATLMYSVQRCPLVKELSLAHNKIGRVGCQHIAKLFNAGHCLERLCLDACQLTDSDIQPLLNALVKNTTSLKHLSLSGNGFGPSTGELLAQVLGSRWNALESLNVAGNPLRDRGAVAIATSLAGNSKLHSLYLHRTSCGSKTLHALLNTLDTNTTLNLVSLRYNAGSISLVQEIEARLALRGAPVLADRPDARRTRKDVVASYASAAASRGPEMSPTARRYSATTRVRTPHVPTTPVALSATAPVPDTTASPTLADLISFTRREEERLERELGLSTTVCDKGEESLVLAASVAERAASASPTPSPRLDELETSFYDAQPSVTVGDLEEEAQAESKFVDLVRPLKLRVAVIAEKAMMSDYVPSRQDIADIVECFQMATSAGEEVERRLLEHTAEVEEAAAEDVERASIAAQLQVVEACVAAETRVADLEDVILTAQDAAMAAEEQEEEEMMDYEDFESESEGGDIVGSLVMSQRPQEDDLGVSGVSDAVENAKPLVPVTTAQLASERPQSPVCLIHDVVIAEFVPRAASERMGPMPRPQATVEDREVMRAQPARPVGSLPQSPLPRRACANGNDAGIILDLNASLPGNATAALALVDIESDLVAPSPRSGYGGKAHMRKGRRLPSHLSHATVADEQPEEVVEVVTITPKPLSRRGRGRR